MASVQYQWYLDDHQDQQNDGIKRYCPGCKCKTWFKDSGKRRNNANGRNIYSFAIYKCDQDHTWNMKLGNQRVEDPQLDAGRPVHRESNTSLEVDVLWQTGITCIEIQVVEVQGSIRLDKLLSQRTNISRAQIQKLIRASVVTLNNTAVKPNALVLKDSLISITRA